jgi:hypothetical protein|tara:strand:- start:305 stop:1141 length:837 start_codon:yes stop_codon:yes gene_type:complete
MARATYRTRLETLIANSAISPRDQAFAQSLLTYYERKGRLSAGRVKWVATLEDRYSAENLAAAIQKNGSMLDRLSALHARTEPTSYANGYTESLISQVKSDRRLSERQMEILRKIEAEHDDEAMTERTKWVESYKNDPTLRNDAIVAAHYYKTTGYFRSTADSILDNESFIPTYSQYNKMVKNKYAQKVLAAHNNKPKYEQGQLVAFRASAGAAERRCGDGYLKPNVPMMVIAADAAPVTSAARGAKKYKLLPVGKAVTLMIEERYIMKARKLGSAKK